MTNSGTISTILIIRDNEVSKIARPKAFDRDKAQIQALQVFWRKGYAATSVEDLVAALHLSRSSLYDTFGDKRTLFLDALKLYSQRVISRMTHTLNESASPLAGIQAVFDELAAGVGSEAGAMGCFMVNSVAELVPYDPDVTTIAVAYSSSVQRLLSQALTDAMEKGVLISERTPDQLAAYVFNTVQGLRVLIKSGATREQVQVITMLTIKSLQ